MLKKLSISFLAMLAVPLITYCGNKDSQSEDDSDLSNDSDTIEVFDTTICRSLEQSGIDVIAEECKYKYIENTANVEGCITKTIDTWCNSVTPNNKEEKCVPYCNESSSELIPEALANL